MFILWRPSWIFENSKSAQNQLEIDQKHQIKMHLRNFKLKLSAKVGFEKVVAIATA